MIRISSAQVWVHDQDEAFAFYTDKLGFEVREDVTVPELGNFRWLTVAPPGQSDVAIALMAIPGEPMFDAEATAQVADLVAKGRCTAMFFTTDDVRRDYELLTARGVEFVEAPTERPYGIDCGFRDPSGNHHRINRLLDTPRLQVRLVQGSSPPIEPVGSDSRLLLPRGRCRHPWRPSPEQCRRDQPCAAASPASAGSKERSAPLLLESLSFHASFAVLARNPEFITIAPCSSIRYYERLGMIRTIKLKTPFPPDRMVFVTRKDLLGIPAIQHIKRQLVEMLVASP